MEYLQIPVLLLLLLLLLLRRRLLLLLLLLLLLPVPLRLRRQRRRLLLVIRAFRAALQSACELDKAFDVWQGLEIQASLDKKKRWNLLHPGFARFVRGKVGVLIIRIGSCGM